MKRPGFTLCIFLCLPLTDAVADIVLINDPTLPPSADGFNITRDTSTNLDWLDVDVSSGRSFNDLTGVDGSNEFAAGGDYAGFQYATHEQLTGQFNGPQLDSLYKSLGVPPGTYSFIGGYGYARAVVAVAGCFGSCDNYGYATGILLADDGTESEAYIEAFRSGSADWGRSSPEAGLTPSAPNDGFPQLRGNWLIRDLDSDDDGLTDDLDNCVMFANSLQIDVDGDGIGNACDPDGAPVAPGDCRVNFIDLNAIKIVFFGSDPTYDLTGSATGDPDGVVNFVYLNRVQELFFANFSDPAQNPSGVSNNCIP